MIEYISVDDFKRVYQKKKRKIRNAALLGAVLAFTYFFFQPQVFEAAATFKQSSKVEQSVDLKSLIRTFSSGGPDSSTIPLMLSRSVLSKVIEELGLQATHLDLQNVHYLGEKPLSLFLKFSTPENFEVFDHKHRKITDGRIGEKTEIGDHFFTIASPCKPQKFHAFTLLPLNGIIDSLKQKIVIKPLKEDKNILTLKYTHPDRHKAAALLNTLMTKYEEFLVGENKNVIGAQLQYLNQRQDELSSKLDQDISAHVAVLKKNLQSQGFLGIQEEMASILEPLQLYKKRINAIDVEIAGLEKTEAPKIAYQFGQQVMQQIEKLEKSQTDFRGMTLNAARDLYQNICLQLDDLHAELKTLIFFRDHLHQPHFELSALSNVLKDPITQELVHKASQIEAQALDSINRSGKENERLKETLTLQKKYLESHLNQTLDLGKVRIDLFKEKIGSLHDVIKNLLLKERKVLENTIDDLKQKLQEIPELWHLDKQLKFKAELTKGMMEGLTQIAESKNLGRHLYQVESRPLDPAIAPLAPKPPRLILKTVGAALLFGFASYLYFLIYAFMKGIPVSLTTLRLMGCRTVGMLSHREGNLETLRRMTTFLLPKKGVVALLGKSKYCFSLVELLAFHQKKILIFDCNFDQSVPLRHEKNYDFFSIGKDPAQAFEHLTSHSFAELLSNYKNSYDYVFLISDARLSSQEAEELLKLSDHTVIATEEESVATLQPFLKNQSVVFTQYPIQVE